MLMYVYYGQMGIYIGVYRVLLLCIYKSIFPGGMGIYAIVV